MIPRHLGPLVRGEDHGRDWAGIIIHKTILISMHILEHTVPAGRADNTFHDVSAFIHHSQDRYNGGEAMKIIIGMVANNPLKNIPDFTYDMVGPGLLEPRKSRTTAMTSRVMEWCAAFGLRATNTHEGIQHTDLWTCGTWRSFRKRSQIDYLFVSNGVQGTSKRYSVNHPVFKRSDHRPVYGNFKFDIVNEHLPKRNTTSSRTGWAPVDLEKFKYDTLNLISDANLKSFQQQLGNSVDGTLAVTYS